ncbi:MAG: rod shape-determining protein MreC [Chitinophagaceae bacterium]
MRNIFLFIRRYFHFLLFLVLQILSLTFLFRYNRFHEAAFQEVAGEITGKLDARYSSVEEYFTLKKTNQELAKENVALRRQLQENFEAPDSTGKLMLDSVLIDSVTKQRRFDYYDAKVVSNSVSSPGNIITIHRGSAQGIEEDMGVIGPSGVVGKVVNVGRNYSDVMSMLHKFHKVSAMLKKTGETGMVRWDGSDPHYVLLEGIPKSAPIKKGDSVVTSYVADAFPPGVMVGTVEDIVENKATKFYTLRLKTATNFYNLHYVMVIKDFQREERQQLADSTKKKVRDE